DTFQQLIEAAGGVVMERSGKEDDWGIEHGGQVKHEVGATRMGNDPKKSVLNPYCQAWDVKNLFITDAAPFVSNADKNPTLTITALGWRTSEYIADQVRKLNVKV
ncbi:MAG: GMC family oxidoreductase, partial [Acidobacteriaceae bacterium]|nr:GMC family oxidoreductase [Acidobacteriaceae bacterium]